MRNEPIKNTLGKTVNVKACLISRVIILTLIVIALYFTLDKHYQKIETSMLSLLMILLLVLAVVISIGITAHAFWKYINYDKNT